jgi:molecular chaperone HscB
MSSIPSAPAEREGEEGGRCWCCDATLARSLFCPACEAIQSLPPQADYFEVLGIPRRLVVDADTLQTRYFELSRRFHPDLYQTGPARARSASVTNTAALNRAYGTLRDPFERGRYWLTLQGQSLSADNNAVPADLASLVFDVQEKLDALRQDVEETLIDEMGRIRDQLRERQADLLTQLGENFRRWDARGDDAGNLTVELKTIVASVNYLRTLLRDVDKALEP